MRIRTIEIAMIVLTIAIMCAGCSSTTNSIGSSSVVPSTARIGYDDTGTISGYSSETGKMMTVKVAVEVYGDQVLSVSNEYRFKAAGGTRVGGLAMMKENMVFAFGITNKGSAPIQITGATIREGSYKQDYSSAYGNEVVTVNPGQTKGVYWNWLHELPERDMRFTIEVKSTGG